MAQLPIGYRRHIGCLQLAGHWNCADPSAHGRRSAAIGGGAYRLAARELDTLANYWSTYTCLYFALLYPIYPAYPYNHPVVLYSFSYFSDTETAVACLRIFLQCNLD